eukprot:NODE_303_length_1678_cov_108.297872_g272_i0.p1 GENE.NODE_303_length_1678_cov_108.297872_g272_i0~~NODE_303_length_1678_cov_108.297872_g272_i0.p1  ORF type:complete len:552 (+),score=119.12 NODE_303_length_1678_cov_108.297872_g272_i0:68-1657(+)
MNHFVFALIALLPATIHSAGSTVGSVLYHAGHYSFVSQYDLSAPAHAKFSDSRFEIGWSQLNVSTNNSVPAHIQAHAAGYVEGVLTHELIQQFYHDFPATVYGWKNASAIPPRLQKFYHDNTAWVKQQIASNPHDTYWQQVNQMQEQFNGMLEGFNWKTGLNWPAVQLWTITAGGDLFELHSKYGDGRKETPMLSQLKQAWRPKNPGHCSALFKIKDDLSDVYFGHTAWFIYTCMLRIIKRYNFDYGSTGATQARAIHMSSYPGMLSSFDDFHLMSSGMVSIETSIGFNNKSFYDYIGPDSVLYWTRIMVANRMATNSKHWCETFANHNSGTYNNEWMVLDLSKFRPNYPLPMGSFYVLDQYPGPWIEWADLTQTLNFGHWPSYNMPYFRKLYDAAGYPQQVREHGSRASYGGATRGLIFRRDAGKVESFEEFKHIMRYNNWRHDPLSGGSPWGAISARGDLGSQPSCAGGYDSKASSWSLHRNNLGMEAQAGPTHDQQPVFTFRNATAYCPHGLLGLPVTWNFTWIRF